MRTQVTENGITIPRGMLEGVVEVEIRQQGKNIVVIPVNDDDPIFRIGKEPVKGGVPDASINLDENLYSGK